MRSRLLSSALICLTFLGQTGCKHLGPGTIVADRIPYNEAVACSWKDQMLLNIVKLRYADTPFFIDVGQIISNYQIFEQVAPGASVSPSPFRFASFGERLGAVLGLEANWTDKPTITYTPMAGAQFIRNLTSPLPPSAVLFLVQSGYPADVVFDLTVDSINGIKNASVSGIQLRHSDSRFSQVVQTIRKAQLAGSVGMRIQHGKDKDAVVFFFQDKNIDPDLAQELVELRKLLGLNPDQREFEVVFGAAAANPNQIAILTRSILRMLSELSAFVEVPDVHLAEGIAPAIGEQELDGVPPFKVWSSEEKPRCPFAAVCYQCHWFWIDQRDTNSKRTMAYLMVLQALADTGPKEGLPLVTIQAN